MIPRVVPAYAALLALVYIGLAARVIAMRRSLQVSIGAGGHRDLERRIRVHANFAEYVPITLILLVLVEMRGHAAWYLNLLCLALLAGRLAHAYGVSPEPDILPMRAAGVVLTFAALILAALTLLADAL